MRDYTRQCVECGTRGVLKTDYLCSACRALTDGDPLCEYCGDNMYIPDHADDMKSNASRSSYGQNPRFRGLCIDCKKIAEDSVPVSVKVGRNQYKWL